jgi:nucleoside-diphosphate-sugar epimerase
MRVFVAGSTGVVGSRLIHALHSRGHAVSTLVRTYRQASWCRQAGAIPYIADGLSREAVLLAVHAAKPDAIIHEMTAFPEAMSFRSLKRDFAPTNLLRTLALDHLLDAAQECRVGRVLAQSHTGWPNERAGEGLKHEKDALDERPPAALAEALKAIRYLEKRVNNTSGVAGTVLRYGVLYGPGTAFGPDGMVFEAVRRRQLPLVGRAGGVWSFIHVDDAVSATVRALESGAMGTFNIVDDHPAAVRTWLPFTAQLLGAPAPARIPAWLARWIIGGAGVSWMCDIRGSSNAKAREVLGWQPRYPDWRDGFTAMVIGKLLKQVFDVTEQVPQGAV